MPISPAALSSLCIEVLCGACICVAGGRIISLSLSLITTHRYSSCIPKDVYRSIGIDFEAHNGDCSWEIPISATYVIRLFSVPVLFTLANVQWFSSVWGSPHSFSRVVCALSQTLHTVSCFLTWTWTTRIAWTPVKFLKWSSSNRSCRNWILEPHRILSSGCVTCTTLLVKGP